MLTVARRWQGTGGNCRHELAEEGWQLWAVGVMSGSCGQQVGGVATMRRRRRVKGCNCWEQVARKRREQKAAREFVALCDGAEVKLPQLLSNQRRTPLLVFINNSLCMCV